MRSVTWHADALRSNPITFITSRTYQKWSGDVILCDSGKYCSGHKLQDITKYGLIKIHWFLAFYITFVGLSFVWEAKPTKSPSWRRDCHTVICSRGRAVCIVSTLLHFPMKIDQKQSEKFRNQPWLKFWMLWHFWFNSYNQDNDLFDNKRKIFLYWKCCFYAVGELNILSFWVFLWSWL